MLYVAFDAVLEYASSARSRGLGVIVAAAGGAAHLAGVVASHTTLPVIGIPVKTDMMGGLDSLLSTVQMPGDVPVATVGTGSGGARNAGILAVQILATADPNLADALVAFKKNEAGNAFWESQGFTVREDLNYRNKALVEMIRIDPDYVKG